MDIIISETPNTYRIFPAKAIQRGVRVASTSTHYNTGTWDETANGTIVSCWYWNLMEKSYYASIQWG